MRAPGVPRLNNWVTVARASGESFKTDVFDGRGTKRVGCFLGEPTHRHPVLPRPAPPRRPPCAGPPRPARGMAGFWIRQIKIIMQSISGNWIPWSAVVQWFVFGELGRQDWEKTAFDHPGMPWNPYDNPSGLQISFRTRLRHLIPSLPHSCSLSEKDV